VLENMGLGARITTIEHHRDINRQGLSSSLAVLSMVGRGASCKGRRRESAELVSVRCAEWGVCKDDEARQSQCLRL
jgi:hypothetical protein